MKEETRTSVAYRLERGREAFEEAILMQRQCEMLRSGTACCCVSYSNAFIVS